MSRRDVIGIAQTGTGKTAAFALPILHRLAGQARPPERKSCRILVLSPTRELSGAGAVRPVACDRCRCARSEPATRTVP
jgi:hypothetical protein